MMMQYTQKTLFEHPLPSPNQLGRPVKQQLLKWIGNKQRFATAIIQHFPTSYKTYYEPFLGSGAILGHLAPASAVASDLLAPLIDIWQALKSQPATLIGWYTERWLFYTAQGGKAGYEQIKARFNHHPSASDLVFLSRACYGGVVRFRKDGYMSTPCGIHNPIHPDRFAERVWDWHPRVQGVTFASVDFEKVMQQAQAGDLIYCDPPYSDSQSILYGAQGFSLARLMETIAACKKRGVYIALSLDGSKKTGQKYLHPPTPKGLFEREVMIDCGRSMLKRFQMEGQTLEQEAVKDRLLLTY